MPFLANLFGGKKKEVPKEEPKKTEEDMRITMEKQLHETNMQIAKMEEQQAKNFKKCDKLDAEIRQLIRDKQKTKAQSKIKEKQDIEKQTATIEARKNILTDMKVRLETENMNIESMNVFKGANNIMKQ